MKKFIALIAILLCLFLLAACDAQDVLDQISNKITEATGNAAELADEAKDDIQKAAVLDGAPADETTPAPSAPTAPAAPAVTLPPAEKVQTASSTNVFEGEIIDETEILPEPDEASASDAGKPEKTDFTSLSADECVVDQDGLPHITLDCAGARSINEDVEGSFRYLVGNESCTLYYEYYKNAGRVLSVMVTEILEGNNAYFTPFNLDLATGERLNGGALLELLGVKADNLTNIELQLMGEEFEYEYGGYREGSSAGLYDEQYQRTISRENADTERIWLGSDGRLNFVAKIFALEGVEYNEYPMDTRLRF